MLARRTLRSRLLLIVSGAVLLVGAAFLAGRHAASDDTVSATGEPTPPPPVSLDVDATPAPGQTPDTSKPFWYLPWGALEANLPRYEQVVAGIRLGRGLHGGVACDASVEPIPPEDALGSAVDISPAYLPTGFVETSRVAEACHGEPTGQEVSYYLEPDQDDMAFVRAGNKTFFEAQHGGAITILRLKLRKPEWDPSFPSERIEEGIVAGMPSAIGVPVLPEGWGRGFIFTYDPSTQVLTSVDGADLTVAELRKIAESLLK